jgi:WD40 repeat protein
VATPEGVATDWEEIAVAFSPDEQNLAFINRDHTKVVLRSMLDGNERLLPAAGKRVRCIAFSTDGKFLAAGCDDCLRVFDLHSESSEPNCLFEHDGAVLCLDFSRDQLASGGEDHAVLLWDLRDFNHETLGHHTEPVVSLAFAPDGELLASGSRDNSLRLWDLSTRKVRESVGHKDEVRSVVFSPGGSHRFESRNAH